MASFNTLTITITEPTMNQDAFGSYITFKVNTSTNRPTFPAANFSFLRRFSDFDWLSNIMSQDFPGVIVPGINWV